MLALCLVSRAFGEAGIPISPVDETQLYGYGWRMPSALSVPRLERLLNQASTVMYGTAFRYLGIEEDFFHGHLLFENQGTESERRLVPRAILYHT